MRIVDFIWSRVTATGATVGMALVGLSGEVLEPGWLHDTLDKNRILMLIILALFLIVHSYTNWRREKAQSRGLIGNFENINNNVLHLISDLAELVGRQYHYWVVDLYIEQTKFLCSRRWPFFIGKVLEKKLSVALSEVSAMPLRITQEDDLLGGLVAENEPAIWWDQELTQTQWDIKNAEAHLPESTNERLKEKYGVIKVWPITDDLGSHCKGMLVIHAKREAEAATAALGVLAGAQGDRLCFRAGQNIHGELKK